MNWTQPLRKMVARLGLKSWVFLGVALVAQTSMAQNATSGGGPNGPNDPPSNPLPPDIQNLDVEDYSSVYRDLWLTFEVIAPGDQAYVRLSNGDWEWSQELTDAVSDDSGSNRDSYVEVGALAAGTYLLQVYVENPQGSIVVEDEFEVTLDDERVHHNYVRSSTPRTRVWTGGLDTLVIAEGHKSESIAFSDQMGRASQAVQIQASPDVGTGPRDIVSVSEYDNLGRQTKTRLPYVSEGSIPGASTPVGGAS